MPWDPQAEYLAGLVGAYEDQAAAERFDRLVFSQGLSPNGGTVCAAYGLYGAGEGKLSPLFHYIEQVFPGSLPASAQTRGDCVSHSTRNACLGTLACEIAAGKPDEVTGLLEGAPQVTTPAREDGVLSTEAIYWWRGHGGDGWNCEHSAEVVMSKSGLWLRQNYPELGFDLTEYSGRMTERWGRTPPPAEVEAVGQEHLVRTATRANTFAEVRDLIANGYAITSCGGESFSNRRDENGVSERTRGGWAHAMSYLAVDDRDEVKKLYGGQPLVLVQNSWGSGWIDGPRDVWGTSLKIPHGAFWARWSDLERRRAIAFSGVMGWPAQQLPDWTGGVL